ncbi:MAG TPA: hypothetical protein VD866_13090 [Urbifossiella sp.]|nr:hypothetical protein [Urbifossiella sp.]
MSPDLTPFLHSSDDRIIRRELVPEPSGGGQVEWLFATVVACGLVAAAGVLAAAVFMPAFE